MIAGIIQRKTGCDGVYCRGSFPRRKDRMNIYRIEEEKGGGFGMHKGVWVNSDKAVRWRVEGVWERGER